MIRLATTLWDLIDPRPKRPTRPVRRARPPARQTVDMPAESTSPARPIQARYDNLVQEMKRVHAVRVVKWRSSTSGCAWEVRYSDGRTARLIESPYPRGPMSCAVFMHEIGHHAIGLKRFRPRCLEEFHAWRWGLQEMEARGFNVTPAVLKRRDDALTYAVAKALRRGLRRLPEELVPWAPKAFRS